MGPEEALGEVLRAVRRRRGLSQEALAHAAEIERNYVSLIELGKHSPSVRILFKLCVVLELCPSEFFALVEQRMDQRKSTS
ncbi:helix-turn-helix domain-containing protein [Burkholderia vietnamiensis]|uniref:helix-turn-helix domain-containing protein n=1 Tax=Burkholderia vietnamiensis TaxID=60552 RepID=UPI002653368E|nr:helix-turn-helix transcriptional regulator [Burkholderia vietnamiensis]MDN8035514.1 helix-turn-helix transcriptional regulator [Burkholderia vietnamiensis]